jgi:hypothetical protein
MYFQQIRIEGVSKGTILDAKPHFIAPARGNLPKKPGFYIRDSNNGEVFTGYLYNLPWKDISLEREYKMIVRGIGEINKDCTKHMVLEERLEPENHICINIERQSDKNRFFGRFLRYGIFINQGKYEISGDEIKKSDYLIGCIEKITGEHRFADLIPLKTISKEEYNAGLNRVFREIDKLTA